MRSSLIVLPAFLSFFYLGNVLSADIITGRDVITTNLLDKRETTICQQFWDEQSVRELQNNNGLRWERTDDSTSGQRHVKASVGDLNAAHAIIDVNYSGSLINIALNIQPGARGLPDRYLVKFNFNWAVENTMKGVRGFWIDTRQSGRCEATFGHTLGAIDSVGIYVS